MVVKNFSLEKELEARDRKQKEEEKKRKELLHKKEAKVKQRVITLNVKSWRGKLKRRDSKIRKQQQKLDMMADTKSELKELKKGKGKESRQLEYWKRRSRVLDEDLKAVKKEKAKEKRVANLEVEVEDLVEKVMEKQRLINLRDGPHKNSPFTFDVRACYMQLLSFEVSAHNLSNVTHCVLLTLGKFNVQTFSQEMLLEANLVTSIQVAEGLGHSRKYSYKNLPTLRSTDDIVAFWKERSPTLPLLSGLAKRYLVVPGTSVPSERGTRRGGNAEGTGDTTFDRTKKMGSSEYKMAKKNTESLLKRSGLAVGKQCTDNDSKNLKGTNDALSQDPHAGKLLRNFIRKTVVYKNPDNYVYVDAYKYSFFPRTIPQWNALPGPVVTAPTVESFRARLKACVQIVDHAHDRSAMINKLIWERPQRQFRNDNADGQDLSGVLFPCSTPDVACEENEDAGGQDLSGVLFPCSTPDMTRDCPNSSGGNDDSAPRTPAAGGPGRRGEMSEKVTSEDILRHTIQAEVRATVEMGTFSAQYIADGVDNVGAAQMMMHSVSTPDTVASCKGTTAKDIIRHTIQAEVRATAEMGTFSYARKCEECGATRRTFGQLKAHIMIHTGEDKQSSKWTKRARFDKLSVDNPRGHGFDHLEKKTRILKGLQGQTQGCQRERKREDEKTTRGDKEAGRKESKARGGTSDMDLYILDPGTLWFARNYRNDMLALQDPQEPGADHREFRHAAYRHYVLWMDTNITVNVLIGILLELAKISKRQCPPLPGLGIFTGSLGKGSSQNDTMNSESTTEVFQLDRQQIATADRRLITVKTPVGYDFKISDRRLITVKIPVRYDFKISHRRLITVKIPVGYDFKISDRRLITVKIPVGYDFKISDKRLITVKIPVRYDFKISDRRLITVKIPVGYDFKISDRRLITVKIPVGYDFKISDKRLITVKIPVGYDFKISDRRLITVKIPVRYDFKISHRRLITVKIPVGYDFKISHRRLITVKIPVGYDFKISDRRLITVKIPVGYDFKISHRRLITVKIPVGYDFKISDRRLITVKIPVGYDFKISDRRLITVKIPVGYDFKISDRRLITVKIPIPVGYDFKISDRRLITVKIPVGYDFKISDRRLITVKIPVGYDFKIRTTWQKAIGVKSVEWIKFILRHTIQAEVRATVEMGTFSVKDELSTMLEEMMRRAPLDSKILPLRSPPPPKKGNAGDVRQLHGEYKHDDARKCEECGATRRTFGQLKAHIMIHTGDDKLSSKWTKRARFDKLSVENPRGHGFDLYILDPGTLWFAETTNYRNDMLALQDPKEPGADHREFRHAA
ncbi:hypothetical protein Bbelb_425430 [Branchiostoma belcheri]|nr:hypothetical protein Bbelb_425430 [Branchiostoma belcheri]